MPKGRHGDLFNERMGNQLPLAIDAENAEAERGGKGATICAPSSYGDRTPEEIARALLYWPRKLPAFAFASGGLDLRYGGVPVGYRNEYGSVVKETETAAIGRVW
ncbi:hypothetical protein GEMMAAP_12360 [Gemmatimonas phototrophica]|uniref:Uncharacterized protein n=1 Tax=Gemmatimonas phototrophica TaxID=1379270 RepID=A0A143BLI0_9BACT|nr:hypothetical protein GEMMAAP_12360 [Gemmatimonas phototrophica]